MITDLRVTPANVHDNVAAETLHSNCTGWPWVIVTTGNQPCLTQRERGLFLLTLFRSAKHEHFRLPIHLTYVHYRIETVIGQLEDRFHIKEVRAREAWHLTFC